MSKETFEEWSDKHTNGMYCESRREIWNYRQKEIDELEFKLDSERKSTRGFSDALKDVRLRHGATERKLAEAVELIDWLWENEPKKI